MNGLLKEGELLPSIRSLARDLRISVITTKRAYEELERDGFIETVAGKGSYVARRNHELVKEEHCRMIEKQLLSAVELAKISHISLEELEDILTLLYKEES